MLPGHFINHRQPEIANKTGSTYTAETITARIEISATNLGFTMTESSKKVSERDYTATDNWK